MTDDESLLGDDEESTETTASPNATTSPVASDAARVIGEGIAASGQTVGVYGETDGTTTYASGVGGRATAMSGEVFGLLGETKSASGRGVVGDATVGGLPGLGNGYPIGVYGVTDRTTDDGNVFNAFGVVGDSRASAGTAYGVLGTTNTPGGAGVVGTTSGDAPAVQSQGDCSVEGNLEVTGVRRVGKVGASVYRSNNLSIPEGTATKVVYDTEIADQRGEYDTSTGDFTCAYDGNYHVEASLAYRFGTPPGGRYQLVMKIDGATRIRDTVTFPNGATATGAPTYIHLNLGKTLYGLTSGDVLTVETTHYTEGGNSQEVFDSRWDTFMTVDQVG